MRPKLQKLIIDINKAGGPEAIFDRIAAGERIRPLMASFGVSAGMFYNWIKTLGADGREAYELAKKASAEPLVEEGLEQLEVADGVLTNADVSLRGKRADYLRFMASKRDPDQFGDKQAGVQVNLNLGALHLQAARQLGGMPSPQIQEAEILAIEGESEDGEEVDSVLAELREV